MPQPPALPPSSSRSQAPSRSLTRKPGQRRNPDDSLVSAEGARSLAQSWASRPNSPEGAEEWYTEALQRWLRVGMSPHTRRSYGRTLKAFFAWLARRSGALLAPHEVRESDVEAWVEHLNTGAASVSPDLLNDPVEQAVVRAIERTNDALTYDQVVAVMRAAGASPTLLDDEDAVGRFLGRLASRRCLERIPPPDDVPATASAFLYAPMPEGDPPAPSTIVQRLAALNSFFTAMRGADGRLPGITHSSPVGASPVLGTYEVWHKLAAGESDERRYSRQTRPEDLRMLEAAIREAPGVSEVTRARDWALVTVLVSGGFRLAEIVNAKNRDMQVDGQRADGTDNVVLHITRKRGKKQTLALEPAAVTAIDNYRTAVQNSSLPSVAKDTAKLPDAPLIAAVGRRAYTLEKAQAKSVSMGYQPAEQLIVPLTETGVELMFRKYVTAIAGSNDELAQELARRLHPHGLRHLYASIWVQLVPLHEVQQRLGHSSTATTDRYLPKVDTSRLHEPGRLQEEIARRSGTGAVPIPGSRPTSSASASAPSAGGARKRRVSAQAGQRAAAQGQPTSAPTPPAPPSKPAVSPPAKGHAAGPQPPAQTPRQAAPGVTKRAPTQPPVGQPEQPSAPQGIRAFGDSPTGQPEPVPPEAPLTPPVVPETAERPSMDRDVYELASRFEPAPEYAYDSTPVVTTDILERNGVSGAGRGEFFRRAHLHTGNWTLLPYVHVPRGRGEEARADETRPVIPVPSMDPNLLEGVASADGAYQADTPAPLALERAIERRYEQALKHRPTEALALVTWTMRLLAASSSLVEGQASARMTSIGWTGSVPPLAGLASARSTWELGVRSNVRAHSTQGIIEFLDKYGKRWTGSLGGASDLYERTFESEAFTLSFGHRASAAWAAYAVYDPPPWMLATDDPIGDRQHGVADVTAFLAWSQTLLSGTYKAFGKEGVNRVYSPSDDQAFKAHPKLLEVLRTLQAYYADAMASYSGAAGRTGGASRASGARERTDREGWLDKGTQATVKAVCAQLRDPSRAGAPFDPTRVSPSRWRAQALLCAGVSEPDAQDTVVGHLFEGDEQAVMQVFDRLRWDVGQRTYITDAPFREKFTAKYGLDPQLIARRALRALWERRLYLVGVAASLGTTEGKKGASALTLMLAFLCPAPAQLERLCAEVLQQSGSKPGLTDLREAFERSRVFLVRSLAEQALSRDAEEDAERERLKEVIHIVGETIAETSAMNGSSSIVGELDSVIKGSRSMKSNLRPENARPTSTRLRERSWGSIGDTSLYERIFHVQIKSPLLHGLSVRALPVMYCLFVGA